MSVDAYASKFLRLSRFALTIVAEEPDRANRFQQGLRLDIQKLIASQELETYARVLTSARRTEAVIQREAEVRQPTVTGKRQHGQAFGAPQQ